MTRTNEKRFGYAVLMAMAGVLMYSTKAVFVRVGYAWGLDTMTMLLMRMLFALPVYLIVWIMEPKDSGNSVSYSDFGRLSALGLIGYYLSSYMDFKGLQYIEASLERLVLFVYPTIVVIIGRIVFKVKIELGQVLAIFMTYVGLVVIFSNELMTADYSGNVLLGVGYILVSAVLYAVYISWGGSMIAKVGSVRFNNRAMVISCLAVIVHASLDGQAQLLGHTKEVYMLGIALAVICTVIPSYLISYAIGKLGGNNVAIIGALGPVSTISLSVIILGEILTIPQIIGGVIIVIGVMLVKKVGPPKIKLMR